MNNAAYRKEVLRTLSVKPAKKGLRGLARSNATTNLAHGIVGMSAEIGEINQALNGFLQGFNLDQDQKAAARPEFGDLLYFTTLAAKVLKIKLPSSTKKVRLKGSTLTQAFLTLADTATDLQDCFKKTFYSHDLNREKIVPLVERVIDFVWPLVYELYGVTPDVLMDENSAKLRAKFPEGFTPEAELAAKADASIPPAVSAE